MEISWRAEAKSRCSANKTSKGRDLKGFREGFGNQSKSNNPQAPGAKQAFSYLDHSTNPMFQDTSKSNDTQKNNSSSSTTGATSNEIQTECSYCLTLCEVSTILSLQSPVSSSSSLLSLVFHLILMIDFL